MVRVSYYGSRIAVFYGSGQQPYSELCVAVKARASSPSSPGFGFADLKIAPWICI
jgi:hypothetical protein